MSNKMVVKITTESPTWTLINQLPKSGFEQYQFEINNSVKECDYWFVFDGLQTDEEVICPKKHTIFTTWEPPTFRTYSKWFIRQFYTLVTCHTNLNHPHIIWNQQSNPWYVKEPYEELKDNHPAKTKDICLITSTKLYTDGHRARLTFAHEIKKILGDRLDLFGRGIQDFSDKGEALSPYKYSIVIENSQHEDYFTEKLADAYLTETYPFYFGCKNIESYFPKGSYIKIDLTHPQNTANQILKIINDPSHYAQSLPDIRKAKELILDKYSLFPFIDAYIQNDVTNSSRKEAILLRKEPPIFLNSNLFESITLVDRTYSRITSFYNKIVRRIL